MRHTLLINIVRWSCNPCNALNTSKKSRDVIPTPALKMLPKKPLLMCHPLASELFCLAIFGVALEHYMPSMEIHLQSHVKGDKHILLSL